LHIINNYSKNLPPISAVIIIDGKQMALVLPKAFCFDPTPLLSTIVLHKQKKQSLKCKN